MRLIALAALLAIASHSMLPQLPVQAQIQQVAQAIKTPWKLTGTMQLAGRKVQTKDIVGDVQNHEAAGQWLAVTLNVRNASGTRQKSKDVFVLATAKLTDASGKVYEVDTDASPHAFGDVLDKKPFAVGETRSVRLLFDVPANIRVRSLTILGDDVKGETQEFQVKL